MPTSVITGRLTAVESGHIVLGQDLIRITVPPPLSTANLRIGASLAVVVREVGGQRIAVSIGHVEGPP
jgi:hypothetical protein